MTVPDFDTLRMNPQQLSHFFDRQHASLAETIIARRKLIAALNARHDARREAFALAEFARLIWPTLIV